MSRPLPMGSTPKGEGGGAGDLPLCPTPLHSPPGFAHRDPSPHRGSLSEKRLLFHKGIFRSSPQMKPWFWQPAPVPARLPPCPVPLPACADVLEVAAFNASSWWHEVDALGQDRAWGAQRAALSTTGHSWAAEPGSDAAWLELDLGTRRNITGECWGHNCANRGGPVPPHIRSQLCSCSAPASGASKRLLFGWSRPEVGALCRENGAIVPAGGWRRQECGAGSRGRRLSAAGDSTWIPPKAGGSPRSSSPPSRDVGVPEMGMIPAGKALPHAMGCNGTAL